MIADMGHYGRQWHKVIMSVLVLCGFMVSPCVTLATPPEFPTLQPAIGANLPAITDYARTPVYADLMHQARRFGTAATPWDERALLGDDGWPVGDFGVFLMTGQAGVAGVAGRYTISFIGQAEVKPIASQAKVGLPRYDPRKNRTTLTLDLPAHADQLALSFTRTQGNVRDLTVTRPGYDAIHPPLYTQAFLEHLKRFQTLRFMDWLRTNNNDHVSNWSARSTPQRTHYASAAGVPWEHIVTLANQTDKDIWVNIPVKADDDYIRQLAKLLKATLKPHLRIYVEYSNELWNAQFRQFGINRDLAIAEAQDDRSSPLRFDNNPDKNVWMYRRIAKRLKEISDIFRSVYGDAAMMNTVRPVFASQVVQPYVTELGLKFIESVYGPPSRYFHAIAGAPYFNLGALQTSEQLSSNQVLQAMTQSVERLPAVNRFEHNLALAQWYGLQFLAYEGGADTFGPGSIQAKKDASLDPRMQSICRQYLQTWFEHGGGLFMWFTAGAGNWDTKYGSWELSTDLSVRDTPKIRCIDAQRASPRPAISHRNQIPGTLDALAYVGNLPPYSDASRNAIRYLRPNAHVDYLVYAPQGGVYHLILNAHAGRAGNAIDVAVDGAVVARGFELRASGWKRPQDNSPIPMKLTPGFHTLRITTRNETSGYGLQTLTVR